MPEPILIALAIYFALITILSSLKPRYIPGKAIYLFRVFFPSWRFYEDICEMPMLYYRSVEPEGEWKEAWQKPKRSWKTLFVNPEVNYLFACQSLLNQVENDVNELGEAEHTEFARSVSYRLLQNLVLYQMRMQREGSFKRYQFKLMAANQGVEQLDDVLISPVYEVDGPKEDS